ncbi:MAG: DUF305 domain-containing protein [Gemmatimonadota bacterium]|nr:DUF305 domain-containing protein [Gemmatimonadota bacterium]
MKLTMSMIAALATSVAGCASGQTSPPPPPSPSPDAAPRTVQPGAPGEDSRVLETHEVAGFTPLPHTEADIRFMQGMISHHAQAIEMAALIADRAESQGLMLLGRRIDISQRDEIGLMERWLAKRGESGPGNHGHGELGAAHHSMMPGMLSVDEMARLAAASGTEFDRLFLEGMIEHHEGALTMVAELFAANGGQEVEVFRFASDVDADQFMEIERMRAMLDALPPELER